MIALLAVALVLGCLVVERYLATGAQMRMLGSGHATEGRATPVAVRLSGLRRMGLIRACVAIAPLLGLLGTVAGIIETFQSILQGGYLTQMGHGISQALLTTQYGLTIAVPGLVAERVLVRRMERVEWLARSAHATTKEARDA